MDACKFNDLLRTIPYGSSPTLFNEASTALRSALTNCIGAPLTSDQWTQATLPIRMGGLGLRDPLTVQIPDRLSTIASYLATAKRVLSFPEHTSTSLPPDYAAVFAGASTTLGPHAVLDTWIGSPGSLCTAQPPTTSQGWWHESFAKARQTHFHHSLLRLMMLGSPANPPLTRTLGWPLPLPWAATP